MLTADLVVARRRAGELRLVAMDEAARDRAREIARRLIDLTREHVGLTRDDLAAAHAAIAVGPREQRLKDGLAKLVIDRCELEPEGGIDPEAIRSEVFLRASAARAALEPGAHFDRAAVLAAVARSRGLREASVEASLFADLRGAHVLRSFVPLSPVALVSAHEQAQAQAVLLRAVKVVVSVRCRSAGTTRALFRRLKFLRLLYSIEKIEDGHRIVIDGPFSLFESSTKYGLQLALVLPALAGCDAWSLEADIRWGKDRTPLVFRHEGGLVAGGDEPAEADVLVDEVRALLDSFRALGSRWQVAPNEAILDLPGIGLCVPDLVFTSQARSVGERVLRVYLEVLGYWSRPAVWKRVELVQAGLPARVLFAVSSRLRVSEGVLDEECSGALYVYKGSMSARAVLQRLDALATSAASKPIA